MQTSKLLKQIINCNSVSRTTVTLFESRIDTDKPYLIETTVENIVKDTPYSIKTTSEEYNNYFRAQYRFLQCAMLYLS